MDVTQPYKNAYYQVIFIACDEYLHVKTSAREENLKAALEVWGEIARRCQAGGYKRVLVEEDINDQLSVADMYEFTTRLLALGFDKLKLAYCDHQPHRADLDLFAEDVAVNRGIDGRVFFNLDEAKVWLLQDAGKGPGGDPQAP